MNQLEIWEHLDKLLMQTETAIEEVFAKRLKEIQFQTSEMYRKYGKKGELSWTDMNKYNRFQKEMSVIADMFTGDYRLLVKMINESNEMQYTEDYLRHAYLFQMGASTEMGFRMPSIATIKKALANPIEKLTLNAVMQEHRNEIVRKINIEIAQSLIAGEGYSTMAERIRTAVGFSRKKARLVARTEAGRARSIADEDVAEQAAKHAEMQGLWMSSLDSRVRMEHRELDGQKTDKEGYFRYGSHKAKAPRLFGVAKLDINCRCVKLWIVNGMIPEYRRGRDYMDEGYQKKLAARIDSLMADQGLTYKQALKKAQKAIKPPSTTIPFVSYEDWKKQYA